MDLIHTLLSNLWALFLIVLFFGGSIFVHELGHFLAARSRGVRVDRFSIGFGPKIVSWTRDGVEYRLSWFPLGGYVALPQLADLGRLEGEPVSDVKTLPPVSFTTKFLVFVAGATFNVLFALVLASIIWVVGTPTNDDLTTTKIGFVQPELKLPDGSMVKSPASEAGLRPGDTVLMIDGKHVDGYPSFVQTLASSAGRTTGGAPRVVFTVEREGHISEVPVFPRLAGDEKIRMVGIAFAEDFIVHEVTPGSPAALAGIQPEDQLVAMDQTPILHSKTYVDYLTEHANLPIALKVLRKGHEVVLTLPTRPDPKVVTEIGATYHSGYKLLHPTPFEQLSAQVVMTFRVLSGLISPHSDLGLSKLSGPVGIARMFSSASHYDFRFVLGLAILLNINLAIFNLLPIPVLDGGQIVFALIGRLRGRSLPINFIAATQSVFMVLLLSLIVYVSFFDMRRWAHDVQLERAETKATETKAAPAGR